MPDHELKAAEELAAEFADRALVRPIQSVHEGIAGRAFALAGLAGGSAEPWRSVHDTIARGSWVGEGERTRGGASCLASYPSGGERGDPGAR